MMKFAASLLMLLALSCGGEIDSTDQPQNTLDPPCECTQQGCGLSSQYARDKCSPFYQECVMARDPVEHDMACAENRASCTDCAVLYSDCVNCFQNGIGGDANGTCSNGETYRGC